MQVAVPYVYPNKLIKMDSSGQVFSYSLASGCAGDSSTGFMIGELDWCAIKWPYRLSPGGNIVRFAFISQITPETRDLGIGRVLLAAKTGSGMEPGFLLGPDGSSAYSSAGLPESTCQVINGFNLRFQKDEGGCTERVYLCHPDNQGCSQEGTQLKGFLPSPPPDPWPQNDCYELEKKAFRMTLRNLNNGNFITPLDCNSIPIPIALKEIGFVGGRNACGEGIGVGIGSCQVTITTQTGQMVVTTNIAGNTSTTCRLPAAPTGFDNVNTTSSIVLSWNDSSTTEDGFKIERSGPMATCSGTPNYTPNTANPPGPGRVFTKDNPYPTAAYSSRLTGTPYPLGPGNEPAENPHPRISYTDTDNLAIGSCYCYRVRGYLKGGGIYAADTTQPGWGAAAGPKCVKH